VTEDHYWMLAACLPGLALAVLAGYATGAGCYASNMNCFSIVVPDDSLRRAMFAVAAFLPFAAPAYLPIAIAGLGWFRRGGARAVTRWLWLAPLAYAAIVHAACIAFASWVLPERRVDPTLRLDALVLAAGYAYVALARLAKRVIVRVPRARSGIEVTRAS
jgi:hypothetical protein